MLTLQWTLTWMTTPMIGRFRVCPGTGAGHWSISLQTVDTGGQCQEPSHKAEMSLPWPHLMTTHLLPGRVPASQSIQAQSGLGATETAGRTAGGTPALKTVMRQDQSEGIQLQTSLYNSGTHGWPGQHIPATPLNSCHRIALTHVSGLDKKRPDAFTIE